MICATAAPTQLMGELLLVMAMAGLTVGTLIYRDQIIKYMYSGGGRFLHASADFQEYFVKSMFTLTQVLSIRLPLY